MGSDPPQELFILGWKMDYFPQKTQSVKPEALRIVKLYFSNIPKLELFNCEE